MKLEPFSITRMQCVWENNVEYNLSESGVIPLTVQELVSNGQLVDRLLRTRLAYSQSNGTSELRRTIADLYQGADEENILVTNSSTEAILLSIWSLIEPDDEVVYMLPGYMQVWGMARSRGANIRPFYLKQELRWQPDEQELRRAVTSKTKLIVVCNPNNPTGAALSETSMNLIIDVAYASGAWLFSDEVFQGAEHDGVMTKSFWGRYDKTIIVNGLSKAYGLPGLRIGWIVAPKEQISRLWMHHDYTTVAPTTLSDQLACLALAKGNREAILERTRQILRNNLPVLENWIEAHSNLFNFIPPRAGAIAFLKYNLNINSTELIEKLLHEKSVLIVPGDHFGMDNYVRICYGQSEEYLIAGLNRIDELLQKLKQ